MRIDIYRYKDDGNTSAGVLMINGKFQCHVLENPWRDNEREISCIPLGQYILGRRTEGGFDKRYRTKFPRLHRGMIEVTGVPDRDHILFHIGNSVKDTQGCILTGTSANDGTVGQSTVAYKAFYRQVDEAMENGEWVVLKIHEL